MEENDIMQKRNLQRRSFVSYRKRQTAQTLGHCSGDSEIADDLLNNVTFLRASTALST